MTPEKKVHVAEGELLVAHGGIQRRPQLGPLVVVQTAEPFRQVVPDIGPRGVAGRVDVVRVAGCTVGETGMEFVGAQAVEAVEKGVEELVFAMVADDSGVGEETARN